MLNRVRRADLNASVAAYRRAPLAIQERLKDAARTDLREGWGQELKRPVHVYNQAQVKFIAVPRATVHAMGITAWAGAFGTRSDEPSARALEFGTLDREKKKTYRTRSPKGTVYQVTRRTRRQLPTRSTRGWIAYPAKDRFASRVGKLWGAIVARVLHDATEGEMS